MSKVFVRSLAVIISSAGFLVVQTTGAQAASDVAPESVSVWFEQEAASVVRDVLHDGAFGVEGEGRTAGGEYAVGAPTRLFEWSDDLGGEGNLPPVEATEVWVAPFIYGGQVRGTVAAELIGRDVIFAYLDDDVTGGLALMNSPGEQVVQDPRLGGLLSLDESGAAQGMSAVARAVVQDVDDLQELREVLDAAEERANHMGGDAAVAGGAGDISPASSGGSLGSSGPIAGGVLMVMSVGLVVASKDRRATTARRGAS